MNLDEDVELDCILAGADFTEGGKADDEPGLTPELVGAVVLPQLMLRAHRRWHSTRGG